MTITEQQRAWVEQFLGTPLPGPDASLAGGGPRSGARPAPDDEDELPPVSMSLPGPGEKARRRPAPKPPGPAGVSFGKGGGEVIAAGDLGAKVATLVSLVSEQARGSATRFGVSVASACDAFKAYADQKIADIKEDEDHVGELIGSLALVVTGAAEIGLAAKLAEGAGKEIAKVFIGALKDKVVAQAKTLSKSSDVDDLPKAVAAWSQGARNAATAVGANVERLIVKPLADIQAKVQGGDRPTPEEDRLLMQFMDLTVPQRDAVLTRYGIPSPGAAKRTQLAIYSGLIERFEEFRIKAQTPSGVKMEWVITGVPVSVHRRAKQTAAEETRKQREDIERREAR